MTDKSEQVRLQENNKQIIILNSILKVKSDQQIVLFKTILYLRFCYMYHIKYKTETDIVKVDCLWEWIWILDWDWTFTKNL